MSDKSSIEWCDSTWNVVTGCTKVSQGCKNCYAETIANRFWGERKFTDVQCHEDRLDIPPRWKKPRRVFVNSMSDLFHPVVTNYFIREVWKRMAKTSHHTYQILTKRPERMLEFTQWMAGRDHISIAEWPRNVWLGVSCEDQATADERIPILLQTPAAVRFVSLEPLLGPIDLDKKELLCYRWRRGYTIGTYLDWVIVGGESGPHARPMHPDWARSIRDQCQRAGVPFFMKQWGEWLPNNQVWNPGQPIGGEIHFWEPDRSGLHSIRIGKKIAGRLLDGREWSEYPDRPDAAAVAQTAAMEGAKND